MSTNKLIHSKKFKIAVVIVGAVLIVLVSFAAGVAVGLTKARFSYRFGENYERNFAGPRMMGPGPGPMGRFMGGFEGRNFRNAHGLAGTVVSVSGTNLVVKDRNGQENNVAVSDNTVIKSGRDTIKIADLQNNEWVVIMGKPGDSGVINADLIRVFPNNNPPNPNPDNSIPNPNTNQNNPVQ